MSESSPPRELVVDAKPAPGDSSAGAGTAMLPVVLPVVAAGLLAKYASPMLGLVGLAGGIAIVVAMRKPREGRFVLRVEDGVLSIGRERRPDAAARLALVDLLDVTLERKTQAGGRGGAANERVRLAFERREAEEPFFVPDERITPIEGQEWLGKVRVFLRKHGWLPDGERREEA